jgi:Tfp pilus assembly protein PilN
MTAADEIATATELSVRPGTRSQWRPLLAFGTGVAIEIAGDTLELALVKVRPGGPELLRRATIVRRHERPAAEWALEFREFVRGHETSGVTILLPRRDIIVRHVALPGVSRREMAGALALRMRALHPFPEDDVAWCWTPAPHGALVGLTRMTALARYETLFAEAGIPVSGFTFSASVVFGALRLMGQPALPFLGLSEIAAGVFEAYGEGDAGTIFTGEFTGAASRAASAGAAELRMTGETEPVGLAQLLPRKSTATGANPIDRPFLYAAAIAAACPWLVRTANFLPPERRAGQSRIWLIPTAVLGFLLLLCTIAWFAIGPYRERDYLNTLRQEIAKAEPGARRAATVDKQVEHTRAQIQLLDQFRGRSQADFEVLNELTRILPPPTWASLVEIYPDYVIIAGQAEQAAPLLKVIDSSPLFQNSEFTNSVSRTGKDELFRIKTYRRRK